MYSLESFREIEPQNQWVECVVCVCIRRDTEKIYFKKWVHTFVGLAGLKSAGQAGGPGKS